MVLNIDEAVDSKLTTQEDIDTWYTSSLDGLARAYTTVPSFGSFKRKQYQETQRFLTSVKEALEQYSENPEGSGDNWAAPEFSPVYETLEEVDEWYDSTADGISLGLAKLYKSTDDPSVIHSDEARVFAQAIINLDRIKGALYERIAPSIEVEVLDVQGMAGKYVRMIAK